MDIPDGRITKSYDCHTCGSIYKVSYDDDEVDIGYSSIPEYCPFCGTKHEDIDEELGMDFDDHAAFGKGVEHMDEDDYNGVDE